MLTLTPETLRAAYEFLNTTDPFRRWNLPDGEDVRFLVTRDTRTAGWHTCVAGKHTIAVSRRCVGYTASLIGVMAHEMVYVHEAHAGACGKGEHSAAFHKWSAQVCKHHGIDPKAF